jgi:peptide/nickel transport system permease protein
LLSARFLISSALIAAVAVLAVFGPSWYPVSPVAIVGRAERPPSQEHPLGTDARGRDVLAQIVHGTRTSLFIGLLAAVTALTIGGLIGALAGFKRGFIDDVLMLLTNLMLAFPAILLLLLVAVFLPVRGPVVVALLLGFTAWPWLARAVRAQIMSLKEREFVALSRMAGLSDIRIALADLLPNMGSYMFMAFVLLMSGAMLAEAGLSMIGMGLTEGVSLGIMLFWAQMFEAVRRELYWWFIPPGAVLVALSTSLLVFSTALDEYFSPRLKGS